MTGLTRAAQKLAEFLSGPGQSQNKFAHRIGIPQQTLSMYVRGVARPRTDHRRRVIALATGGFVAEADWLTDEERAQLRKAERLGASISPTAA